MIYITNNKEIKKYYYNKLVIPEMITNKEVYTDIKDDKLLKKLNDIGFKFSNLRFGDKIEEMYYYDGYKFLRLYKRREIDCNKGEL
jgi:hypothetical protein